MWQDSKRPYEIPSSLSLLGFGSDRRLAARSLSKTSTPLRMTGEGLCGCNIRLPCARGGFFVPLGRADGARNVGLGRRRAAQGGEGRFWLGEGLFRLREGRFWGGEGCFGRSKSGLCFTEKQFIFLKYV